MHSYSVFHLAFRNVVFRNIFRSYIAERINIRMEWNEIQTSQRVQNSREMCSLTFKLYPRWSLRGTSSLPSKSPSVCICIIIRTGGHHLVSGERLDVEWTRNASSLREWMVVSLSQRTFQNRDSPRKWNDQPPHHPSSVGVWQRTNTRLYVHRILDPRSVKGGVSIREGGGRIRW